MNSGHRQFIGINGFRTRDEVSAALKSLPANSARKLMVGVFVRPDSFEACGKRPPEFYPDKDNVAGIFKKDKRAVNLLCVRNLINGHLREQLEEVMGFAGGNCDGVQICAAWPSVTDLVNFVVDAKPKTVALRVGNHAVQLVGNCAELMAEKIEEYVGCVDYVFIDRNGPNGKLLGSDFLERFLESLAKKNLPLGVGVVGGTLQSVQSLISCFGVSVCGETELRDMNSHLNLGLVANFIGAAERAMSGATAT